MQRRTLPPYPQPRSHFMKLRIHPQNIQMHPFHPFNHRPLIPALTPVPLFLHIPHRQRPLTPLHYLISPQRLLIHRKYLTPHIPTPLHPTPTWDKLNNYLTHHRQIFNNHLTRHRRQIRTSTNRVRPHRTPFKAPQMKLCPSRSLLRSLYPQTTMHLKR